MNTTAFQITPEQGMLFFQICMELNLNTEEERTVLLHELAKHGQVERFWTTKRSKERFLTDLSRHFKILQLKPKKAERILSQ